MLDFSVSLMDMAWYDADRASPLTSKIVWHYASKK